MSFPSIALLLTLGGIIPQPDVTGRVLDDASEQPIQDAHVAVTWSFRGADMVGSRTSCSGLQTTKTKGSGEFRLEARHSPSDAHLKVFKAGLATHKMSVDKDGAWEIRMKPFTASFEDRKREYGWFWALNLCGNSKRTVQ